MLDVEIDAGLAEYHGIARSIGLRAAHSTPILTRSGEALGALAHRAGGLVFPWEVSPGDFGHIPSAA